MTRRNFSNRVTLIAGLVGIVIGVFLMSLLNTHDSATKTSKKVPLYWVAPMDPNFRKSFPGKSPMGMDLIPVYDESAEGNDAGTGTINVSPNVINNLGVRTAIARRGFLNNEIITVGYIQFDESRLIHIHPRVSGWVEELHIKTAGDPVEKGKPLYSLYSPELVNAQEELLLAVNRKNTRFIRAAEDRLKALQISDAFIQNLKRTKKIQQTVNFYAPQSGVVAMLGIREGFFVEPGTTMLSIGALDQVWVEAEIFELQASLISLNDPVTMTLDYLPGRTWKGNIDYIYPTLDEKTRTVRIRLIFDNSKRELKPNMFAQISVRSRSEEKLLVIPRESLIRTEDEDRVVLALGEGRFKSITVKSGQSDHRQIEIISGLKEGEQVVSSAQFLLDSESSKTSDFKRMDHTQTMPSSVWVAGKILNVTSNRRIVSASHEAIEEWSWPKMTMDFSVNTKIDMDSLREGTQLHMELKKLDDGQYEISNIHFPEHSDTAGDTDHSNMNSETKSHSSMDHSSMEHSSMEHSTSDQSNHDSSDGE